jgi:hypothetical protein
MNRIERQSSKVVAFVGFLMFFFSVFYNFAFAQVIYDRDPNSNGTYSTITFNVDFNDQFELLNSCDSNWNLLFQSSENTGSIEYNSSQSFPKNQYSASFTENFNFETEIVYVLAMCDFASQIDILEGDGTQILFNTFIQNSETYNSIWNGNNGFWGSTTISDVGNTLTASVQNTNDSVLPLLTFVGIPIGFLIAGILINMINNTLTPAKEEEEIQVKKKRGRPRKTVINPNGEDLITQSASDLEFKRNYGRSKKDTSI